MAKNNDIGLFQWGDKDQYWGYRITLKINGKRKDTTSKLDENGNPYKTKLQAKKARELKIVELRTPKEETISNAYISEIWQYYLDNDSKSKANGTVRKYASLWKIHVKKDFGDKLISEINISDLYNYLCNLYNEGYSYKYVESFLKMFYMLFGIAYRLEKISTERYTRMFLDKGTKLKMPPISQEDYEEFENIKIYNSSEISKIEKIFQGGNCELVFMLGYYCGLRVSEVFGIFWDDYNWHTHQLKINKQMVYDYDDKCFCLTPVKTLTSSRVVDVPDILHNFLLKRYEELSKIKKENPIAWTSHSSEIVLDKTKKGIVEQIQSGDFMNRKNNGELLTINSLKFWSKKIKKELGIDFKFHSLRKTHISLLAAMNTPTVEVMKRVGHKKFETTMRYYINQNDITREKLINNINSISTNEKIFVYEINGEKLELTEGERDLIKGISAIVPH